ncbi:YaaA family protein [Acholeplasma vituli]|uniref:YaaA family protein n=1 Tax=Paracholeplasma vituli TaxID=69473 RepID=A0ABT2PX63_9MOLU|nr:YaaA family protein [Paracholeplasma vituli]MCU0105551.1 YaaA family protein [Paracholeplasma vituli]
MIILFSPAKSFRVIEPSTEIPIYTKETLKLVEELASWDEQTIKKRFKVSDALIPDVKAYYQNFKDNVAYHAIDLYFGESFKKLDSTTLSSKARIFLQNHVWIVDALYGLIRPLEPIKPYRLDYTISGLSLNSLWHSHYENRFKGENEPILSLASDEFTVKIKPFVPVYEVHFIDCKNGVCKAISVFNKQQRGALLRHIALNEINDIKDLPKEFNGYTLTQNGLDLTYQRTL